METAAPSAPTSTPTSSPSSSAPSSTPSAPSKAPVSATPSKTPAPVSSAKTAGSTPAPDARNLTPDAKTEAKPETPAEKKSRKVQIKVDKQVEEIDLDSLNDDDIVKHLQMSRAAAKRMQEAAEVRKQFQDFQKWYSQDPFEASKAFGMDLEKLAEERLAKKFTEAAMPEEQREMLKLQRELESYKAKETAAAKERETRETETKQRALQERVYSETRAQFEEALSSADLPKSKETMRMMAEAAALALENGIELTPRQLAAEVNRRLSDTHQHFIRSLKGDALVKHLGEDVVKELSRFLVAKAKAAKQTTFSAPPAAQQNVDIDERPQRVIKSAKDFRKAMRE